MASEGRPHPRGVGSLRLSGGRTQRHALLLPVHPHEDHQPPQTPFHHLPPVHPAAPPRGIGHQLVSLIAAPSRTSASVSIIGNVLVNLSKDQMELSIGEVGVDAIEEQ